MNFLTIIESKFLILGDYAIHNLVEFALLAQRSQNIFLFSADSDFPSHLYRL